MNYKGKKLVLDTFRNVLKNFSVDIQDVVRSAILDDVDITGFIAQCSDNPFRLDQIRLCIKDGLPESYYRFSGHTLYKVRQLQKKGINTSAIESQSSNLSEGHIGYYIRWLESGFNVSGLDVAKIPSYLLDVFDYGLRNGFDMVEFNSGRVMYDSRYIKACLKIKKTGKPISSLLSGGYSIEAMEFLGSSCMFISKEQWNNLLGTIDERTNLQKIKCFVDIAKNNIDTRRVKNRSEIELGYIIKALESKLNIVETLINTKDGSEMEVLLQTALLGKGKIIKGRLRKL